MPALIRVQATATLAAGTVGFIITVKELGDGFWSYNINGTQEGIRRNRAGYGRLSATDHLAALRQAAGILATGHAPGTVERGLLEDFAQDKV
jgi:hypothetical protein